MSPLFFARQLAFLTLATVAATCAYGQSGYVANGGEYPIAGSLLGDQVTPDASINSSGGFIVWADNITDGSGQGISARQLDGSLSGSLSTFRVNAFAGGDQEKPKVVLLNGGGAVFVWQGGNQGSQQIYARFLSTSNTWMTGDVLVNTYTNNQHQDAAIAKLADGGVVVVYSSMEQDGNLQGVYGQRFTAAGVTNGPEFSINQTTILNQRTPAVVSLSDSSYVVAWVTEAQATPLSYNVSIYARRFSTNGSALSGEFMVNEVTTNICANPSLAALASGGFAAAWSEKDLAVKDNDWDVFARVFSNAGVAASSKRRLNTMQYGDQIGPKLATVGNDYLAVWTSLGQDGDWEGVYGQFMASDSSLRGGEFRVNTTTVSRQMQPALASDGTFNLLTIWSGYIGGDNSFDLFAQRYQSLLAPLNPPSPPIVTVLSSSALSVTWPAVQGLSVTNYSVYADDATTPTATVVDNWWTHTNLSGGSLHHYKIDYVLADGRRSPQSTATTNQTYFPGTYGGIPYEWMNKYFLDNWPAPTDDSDGDGVSNLNEFLAGTNPTNKLSVLRTWVQPSGQGAFVFWNTEPGLIYQPQQSLNLGAWSNLGGPRFAAGTNDSLYVGGAMGQYYRYRIWRLR